MADYVKEINQLLKNSVKEARELLKSANELFKIETNVSLLEACFYDNMMLDFMNGFYDIKKITLLEPNNKAVESKENCNGVRNEINSSFKMP